MRVTFNGNPCTTIVSCYNPTNANDETDITILLNGIYSLARHFPEYNVVIIGVDMNAQKGNESNKFCLHNLPNRNDKNNKFFIREQSLHEIPKKGGKTMDQHPKNA